MKRSNPSYFLLIFIFILGSTAASIAKNNKISSSRIQLSINEHWKFTLDADKNFMLKTLDDSEWRKIDLPHTWNKEDAFDENKTYYRGSGYYRKNIPLNPEWKNKKVFLFFEGANQVADVYVNEKHVGQHKGGYTGFTFEITSFINYENENLLSVKVDNSHNVDIPPLNADFTFYGGIYRDVWIIVTEQVHIDLLNYSSPGIFIDTPEISDSEAKIRIRGAIVNNKTENVNVEVINRIIDKDDFEVAVIKSHQSINKNSKESFEVYGQIKNPHLWSPSDPYLYKVKTEIYDRENLVDEVINPLGIRWFSFNADRGFYLNGEYLKILGTNRHQDYKGYGNALPDQLHENDIKTIKENGFNFLRLAHYPQDPAVLHAADKYGLIIWEEIPIVNLITMSQSFDENCKTMLKEMIHQHYNHPSVLMWGYMNEVMLVKPEVIPDGYYKAIVTLAEELEQIVKSEDEFRITAMALSYGEIENHTGIGNISDLIGMNLYFGWYYEAIEMFGKFLDGYHQRNPDRPVFISEYGAGSDERIHSFRPKAFDFSTEFQQIFHEQTFPQILERDYIIGSAVWSQFDFGSSYRQDTKPLINQKGLYYFNRKTKDIAYYYKAKLLSEPILHIAVDDWKRRLDYNLTSQPIKVYTNLQNISIYLNDKHIGNYTPNNCTILLQTKLKNGRNVITARGELEGESFESISEIFFDNPDFFFNNEDYKTVAINLGAEYQYQDKNGLVWLQDSISEKFLSKNYEGTFLKTHHKIFNTEEDPIFQTAIEGIELISFEVPSGFYEVELFFAEIQIDKIDERVFNIDINNIHVFGDLDLVKNFGQFVGITKKVRVHVKKGKNIDIKFEPIKGKTLLNGIKLYKIL